MASVLLLAHEQGALTGEVDRLTARTANQLDRENLNDAAESAEAALRLCPNVQQPCHATVLNNLASVRIAQRRFDEGDAMLRKALDLAGEGSDAALKILSNLGTLLAFQGHLDRAEPLLRRVVYLSRDPITMAQAHHNMGALLLQQGRNLAARRHLEEAQRLWRQHAPSHPRRLDTASSHAQLEIYERRLDRAASILATALPQVAATHPLSAKLLAQQGSIYLLEHKYREAEKILRRALAFQLPRLAASDPLLLASVDLYQRVLRESGRRQASRRIEDWAKRLRAHPPGRVFQPVCPPGIGDCCAYYLDAVAK